MRIRSLLVALALIVHSTSLTHAQLPAFPGAEGPGSTASGGRGGDVYHVTNLEFDKDGITPGSFKYGINTAPASGRTIVFDVGGTIFQNGGGSQYWFRSGASNITIAGQTAPGSGITIAGVATKFTGNNVILRNLTVRPNKDPVNPTSFTYDSFSLQLTNSIVDHVSASWFTDEGILETDAGANSTIQYALINEGLNYNGHSYGSIIATEVDGTQLSFHHNLYAHNNSRMPRLGSVTGAIGAVTNMANNVFYNWINRAGYSGTDQNSSTNFLNNYYIKGNNNGQTIFTGGDDATPTGITKIYENGANKRDLDKDGIFDGTVFNSTSGSPTAYAGSSVFVNEAFPVASTSVLDSADVALQRVLDYGGANWASRNPIDERIVQSVRSGTGGLINDLTIGVQATEWATVLSETVATTRSANWDTDQDGMPDSWEQFHGLNPSVANNNADFDADGYSDLEEYLNELSSWPAPGAIEFKNDLADSRFARIQNWEVSGQQVNIAGQGVVTPTSYWQPSRFDEARINSGTVVVDAVGQHAGSIKVATNAGNMATFNVTAGWLNVEQTITIGGTATSQGALNLSGGLLRAQRLEKGTMGTFTITGGILSADEIAFSFVNDGGVIAPGMSPGVTHVLGDLSINSGSIALEIAGTTTQDYDRLIVDGVLAAGGTLDVALLGYSPIEGDSFDLLDFGSLTGGFTVMLPSLDTGLAWDVSAFESAGVLSVVANVVENADFDGDGDVDGRDLLVWQRGYGLTGQGDNSMGDANRDGEVTSADLEIWELQYGEPGELSAAVAVPEPTAGILAGTLLMHLIRRRNNRRGGV
ncbi:MAG: hypothetical protein SH868_14655 [Bythopirellula sp.]|nr:hypothetical protein [Bythopirellula sp.]